MSENVYRGKRKFCYALSWVLVVLSVLCIVGLLVAIVLFAIRLGENDALFLILSGAFLIGAVVFALISVWLSRVTVRLLRMERDVDERAVSEESFFAGEGVMATFQEKGLSFGKGEGVEILVPYSQIRATRVCTRTAPKVNGERYVLIEIPARYLTKKGKGEELLPVQLDDKPRLIECIRRYGVPLGGESYEKTREKFKKVTRFQTWNRETCTKHLIGCAVGAVLFILGVVLAFVLSTATVGAVILAFGGLIAVKSACSVLRAKNVIVVYEEGFFKKAEGEPNAFFLWEEIKGISKKEEEGKRFLVFDCGYGDFICREVDGFYEYVSEKSPVFIGARE